MSLTVLHACDHNHIGNDGRITRVIASETWLTKRIDAYGNKHPSNYPKKFKLGATHNPENLKQLLPILRELEQNPKALVIRGKYKAKKINEIVVRQSKYVLPTSSKIICLDIDELALPKHINKLDIKAQGMYVVKILNSCSSDFFPEDMGFIAQGSSSAGFSNNIKLHMWIRNSKPIEQSQLRNLFYRINTEYKTKYGSDKNLVDTALYHEVQAHYTAYPIFEEDTLDPLKSGRTCFEIGSSSHIPESYAKYVKPLEASKEEQSSYVSSITGSLVPSSELQRRVDILKSWDPSNAGFRQKVIATYHTAIQEQYCLDTLIKEITPYINYCRPGKLHDYVTQGITSAIRNVKACSYRSLPNEVCGVKINKLKTKKQKFLEIQGDLPGNAVVFLKATLGTGKTYNIQKMLQNGKIRGKFLALTDTSALVESNTERFSPAADFRTVNGRLSFASGKVQRLSGTLHSLLKIRDMTEKFDFLFIDEADSLMNNLLFASIISEEKKIQIIEVLSDLLQNTDKVVISDGDLSEESVEQYTRLMQGSRRLYKVEHSHPNLTNVVAHKHSTQGSLWGALEAHLSAGDKCLLVSDTSPDKLNQYSLAFARIMPEKVVKTVHSSSTLDTDIKDIIDNTTGALERQEIDALLCSPSVTNGVDFNYFDAVFVLTVTDNHSPNMRFQAMMRERKPKVIHYYFTKSSGFVTGYSDITAGPGFITKARQAYATRREREYKTYIATFNYYLISAGAKVVVIDAAYDNPLDTLDKEQYEAEKIDAILRSKDGVNIRRHNDAFEIKKCIKFYYEVEDLTWDDCKRYLKHRPDKQMAYFHMLYKDYGKFIISGDYESFYNAISKNPNKFYKITGENLRHISVVRILKKCGPTKDLVPMYLKFCEYTEGVEIPKELNEHPEPKELV